MEDQVPGRDDLDERELKELREMFPSAPFPEGAIEERIRTNAGLSGVNHPKALSRQGALTEPPPWRMGATVRTVVAVAAALVLFIGGVEYGRRTVSPDAPTAPVQGGGTLIAESDPALSIQDAGSRYVATLASFSGEVGNLSPAQRRVAREVALATIYAATLELLRESQDDETLRTVAGMVATRREEIGAEALSSPSDH